VLPEDAELISVDDHVVEPPHTWSNRVASADRDRAPHVVRMDDGTDAWVYMDKVYPVPFLGGASGKDVQTWRDSATTFEDMRPGCYDPVARLGDMDRDGVQAQLCFPSFPRYAGHRFLEGSDRKLALECVRSYNDFIIDEWCGANPNRYIPLAIMPLWDPELCVAEVARVADKGCKAIAFSENPTVLGLPSIHTGNWDRPFAAIAGADLAVCIHIGSSSRMLTSSEDAPQLVTVAVDACNSLIAMMDMLFSGLLQKSPTLRVAYSEGGAGWIPYALERADYVWESRRYYSGVDIETRPSDLFKRHIGACFIKDDVAIASRDIIGVERLMWESDYPHADSVWPHSRKFLSESMANVPDVDARAIAGANARRFFRFKEG
jgi:predicted TIM-barrel fold metal-dependent hydrolase